MKKLDVVQLGHFTGHRDCIYALALALQPDRFYTGGAEGFIVEWNHVQKGDGVLLAQVPAPVYFLAVHEPNRWLLAGTAKGNLHVIDLASRKEIRNIEAHKNGLYHITVMKTQPYIITAGGDGFVRIWNRHDLSLLHQFEISTKNVRVIDTSPDELEFAVGCSDNTIHTWQLPGFLPMKSWEAHTKSVFGLAYSPDGLHLLSGSMDVHLKIWDRKQDFAENRTITAHLLHINYIQYTPAGTLFATVSMDKTLKIWDGQTFELLKVIDKAKYQGHLNSVNKVLWLNNQTLITCSDDRSAMLWQLTVNEA